ncbi:hypothetical protein H6F32_02255 [Anabaena sp. FACHB-1237]|uniref:DUF3226 domain-containing protein n=1 Tax=Anabaena sp. FACHB-1237 TaxID=2692769 RepID=UPI00168082B4|nr:DUF3226 domain-containing protein [Anabaena sp. FACHB-1237]MBD2136430.1 hypothetical protein [Anabaena sp. FACHB-1237]
MSSNILIVESKNDQYFLQAIIRYLNFNIEVAPAIMIAEDDYKSMEGLNPKKLKDALNDLKTDIQKGKIEKIGIVIDIDDKQEIERINFVNDCLQAVFPETKLLKEIKNFIDINFDGFNFQIACYFTNVNGEGELETVLKMIKKKDSIYADCLDSWRNCLLTHGKEIKIKDVNKFWVSMYLRFDTCSNKEKRQAEKKCSFEYAMKEKAEIWDFEHPILNDLKDFLQMFS